MHDQGMSITSQNIIHPNCIPQIEDALSARGITVAELCRRAGIAQTTWGRWKKGVVSPTFKTWDAVSASYHDLITQHPEKRAADTRKTGA